MIRLGGEKSMAEQLLTVKEVSEHLKTSIQYVYSLQKSGKLKFMKLGRLKVRESTLNKFLEEWDGYDLTDPNNPILVDINKEEEKGE